MDVPFAIERRAALEAVIQAARACRAVQSEIAAESFAKSDKTPVTVADFASQAIVCRHLQTTFPNDPIVAEEDAAALRLDSNAPILASVARHVQSIHRTATVQNTCDWIDQGGAHPNPRRFWTLDPVDGTKGFLRKEQYAIALALVIKGRVTVAALACPNLPHDETADPGCLFVAVAGQGAFLRSFEDAVERKIHVSPQPDSSPTRFCESVESAHSAHGDSERIAASLGISTPPLRMDSQAKYGVVARGAAEIYLRLPTRADYREKIWDHAAGALIVEEAGGRVCDIDGNPLDFSRGRELSANRGVLVGNARLSPRVLETIKSLGI